MAGSRTSACISLFGSMELVIRMGTLSKNEAVLVLTGVAIALPIRKRMHIMDFIASDALSLGAEEVLGGSLFNR